MSSNKTASAVMTRVSGDMGYTFKIRAMLRLLALLGAVLPLSAAGAKHQVRLPSEVKKVGAGKAKKAHVAPVTKRLRRQKRAAASVPAPQSELEVELSTFSPVLKKKAKEYGTSGRYYSHNAHFQYAAVPLGREFNCDEKTLNARKMEAEIDARSKCFADGAESCEVVLTRTARNGNLRSSDMPNGNIVPARYVRGCVVEALVIGHRDAAVPSVPTITESPVALDDSVFSDVEVTQ